MRRRLALAGAALAGAALAGAFSTVGLTLAGTVAGPAGAEPVTSVVEPCPTPLGLHRYFTDTMEYRVRVSLAGCDWYDGSATVVSGRLVRTDLLGDTVVERTVRCEVGAPAAPAEHHGTDSPIGPPPTPPVAGPHDGTGHEGAADEVRPADDCVLSILMEHVPVERARYTGELHYPAGDGDHVERLSVECTSILVADAGCTTVE